MSTMGKMAALQRQAMRLAHEVEGLLAKVEALRAELLAADGAPGPRGILGPQSPAVAAQAARERDAALIQSPIPPAPKVVVCNIKAAWNHDIFSVIGGLQSAGIPAIIKRGNINQPPSIDVAFGKLEQSISGPIGDTLMFTWTSDQQ